jgi:hypothetical protein
MGYTTEEVGNLVVKMCCRRERSRRLIKATTIFIKNRYILVGFIWGILFIFPMTVFSQQFRSTQRLQRRFSQRDEFKIDAIRGKVTNVGENGFVIFTQDGKIKTITVTERTQFTKFIPIDKNELKIGDILFVLGQPVQDDSLRAMMIRVLSELPPQRFQGKRKGASTIGIITNLEPLTIEEPSQATKIIETTYTTRIIKESPASFSDLKVGSRVMVIVLPFDRENNEAKRVEILVAEKFSPFHTQGQEPKKQKNLFVLDDQDSPFGAHGRLYNDELLSRMGIRWTRLAGPQGLHDSAETQINFERALNNATQNNLQVIVTVKTDGHKYPEDINAYKEFLRNAVNKYKDKVKYYQIENEPAGKRFWHDTPENYARLLKEAYLTIKEACPECKVVMAGATSGKFSSGDGDFYESVFKVLKADSDCKETGCHDIFDLHTASCDVCLNPGIDCSPDGCSLIKRAFDTARNLQNKYGFIKPIWSTEFGYLKGSLINTQKSLIKSFVYALDLGYEKLFWRVAEDCCKILDNNQPTNTYYAYKTLIKKIGGYSTLTKIADGQYKFTFSDKNPVYVLWCDSGNCALPSGIKGSVRVTNYLGNEEVMDASQITLTESPVFVEKKYKEIEK